MNKPSATLNVGLCIAAICALILDGLGRVTNSIELGSEFLGTVLIFLGAVVIWQIAREYRQKKMSIDIIAAIAVIGGVCTGQYEAGLVIVVMYAGGSLLEDYAFFRATKTLRGLSARSPKIAHLLRGDRVEEIVASRIRKGDVIIVRPGEVVPVDGRVIDGSSSLDQSSLTGESVPILVQNGHKVLSGVLNISQPITVRATHSYQQSTYAQILELVRNAQANPAPIHRLADKYGAIFTPFVLIFVSFVYFMTRDMNLAYAVVVVATPCPLLIATPVALISSVARLAKQGIIVKEASAIEQSAEVTTVVFDKTGTLTAGSLSVVHVDTFGKIDLDLLISQIAGIEMHSTHVVADAIIREAQRRRLHISKVDHASESIGEGIIGHTDSHQIKVGSLYFLLSQKVKVPTKLNKKLASSNTKSEVIVGAAYSDRLVAILHLSDTIRPNAAGLVSQLRALRIKDIEVMSGDKSALVEKVARSLAVDSAHAELLPADKVALIRSLSKNGHVMMVGDGVNDAPALEYAQVGVAMAGHGGGIVSESADVVLPHDDVESIPRLIGLSRGTIVIAKQSIFFGMGMSVIAMVCAAYGLIPPVTGAILQELIDVSVILNALRVLLLDYKL